MSIVYPNINGICPSQEKVLKKALQYITRTKNHRFEESLWHSFQKSNRVTQFLSLLDKPALLPPL